MTSRLPGFYKLSREERRSRAAEALRIPLVDFERALDAGGLDPEAADHIVENVLGTYALPFAVAINFGVNGRDLLVPMSIEEPSVVAAASSAALLVRGGGGFIADADEPVMTAQVQVESVPDPEVAAAAIAGAEAELCALADAAVPRLVERGGGARSLEVRDLGEGSMVVHLHVDVRDAMGANLVNCVAEAVGPRIAALAAGRIGCQILTNLCDRRRVRVEATVPVDALRSDHDPGERVRDAIVAASLFAERDPYRAATHNKGILNGIDAVAVATGNDWRAVEAGAHAWAAREGRYGPLCTWRVDPEGRLAGRLELPLALGIVGGPLRRHPGARLALRIVAARSAVELAMIAASAGLATNLAALRALVTTGIQQAHMPLHARSRE